jgi:hypothetical protein
VARRPPSLATRPGRGAVVQRQRAGRPPRPARGKVRLPRRSDPHPARRREARRREARTRRHDRGLPRKSSLEPPSGSLPHQVEGRRPARRNPRVPDRSHRTAWRSAQERRHHGDTQRGIVEPRIACRCCSRIAVGAATLAGERRDDRLGRAAGDEDSGRRSDQQRRADHRVEPILTPTKPFIVPSSTRTVRRSSAGLGAGCRSSAWSPQPAPSLEQRQCLNPRRRSTGRRKA